MGSNKQIELDLDQPAQMQVKECKTRCCIPQSQRPDIAAHLWTHMDVVWEASSAAGVAEMVGDKFPPLSRAYESSMRALMHDFGVYNRTGLRMTLSRWFAKNGKKFKDLTELQAAFTAAFPKTAARDLYREEVLSCSSKLWEASRTKPVPVEPEAPVLKRAAKYISTKDLVVELHARVDAVDARLSGIERLLHDLLRRVEPARV